VFTVPLFLPRFRHTGLLFNSCTCVPLSREPHLAISSAELAFLFLVILLLVLISSIYFFLLGRPLLLSKPLTPPLAYPTPDTRVSASSPDASYEHTARTTYVSIAPMSPGFGFRRGYAHSNFYGRLIQHR
jgi:hypothetical protein